MVAKCVDVVPSLVLMWWLGDVWLCADVVTSIGAEVVATD